jgi:hypothetical protein
MNKSMRFLGVWLLAAALVIGGMARAQAAEPPPLTAQELDSLLAPSHSTRIPCSRRC